MHKDWRYERTKTGNDKVHRITGDGIMAKGNWPDYMTKDTLAARLDLKASAIDQYVKRGLLPAPVPIGDALRWNWSDVDDWIKGVPQNAYKSDDDTMLQRITGRGTQEAGGITHARPQSNGAR